jgi:MoaA/NifB/PqqE/SkfB family radical SAM enzyme
MCQWFQCGESNLLKGNLSKEELSLNEIETIVKQVSRQALISFSGGEPFMRKDMLEILKQVSRRNKCHIITNGTLLSEQDCRVLVNLGSKNLLGKGLILVEISLQGPDEELHDEIAGVSGSFRITLQTIKEIVQIRKYLELAESLGVDICNFMLQHNIIANLNRANQGKEKVCYMRPPDSNFIHIPILREQLNIILSKKIKGMQVRFSPEIPLSEIIDYYLNKVNLRYYSCFSPWARLYIHPYGNFSLCYYCDYGNARLHRIKTVWNSNDFIFFRRRLKETRIFSGCIGCCQSVFNG